MLRYPFLVSVSTAIALAACGTAAPLGGGGGENGDAGKVTTDGAVPFTPPVANRSLGMNDVSFLLPLPKGSEPVLFRASDAAGDGAPFLPKDLVTRVTTVPDHASDFFITYEHLQITAFRFDVCDRNTATPCNASEDGRLRVVYQPTSSESVSDVGFHVFYAIPRAKLGEAVAGLRELATLQAEPITSPLKVHPMLSKEAEGGPYHTKLRAFLAKYISSSKIMRLTVMTQSAVSAAFRWVFHGMERSNETEDFHDITIPIANVTTQDVLLLNAASYELTPKADSPVGSSVAFSNTKFAEATQEARSTALSALASADNPTMGSPATVQCVTCHVSTVITAHRTKELSIDPKTIASRYQAPYDLSITTPNTLEDDSLLRGFGWRSKSPSISQRVVNETAQVLSDCETQFPTK